MAMFSNIIVALVSTFACLTTFQVTADEGLIDTVAGHGDESVVGQPFGVEIGSDGALYICEVANHRVRRLDLKSGKLSTVAGTGEKGRSGDGKAATSARLNEPYEVRFDETGNMFFVEMRNHIVRRVDAKTKIITTVAGTGERGFNGDQGPATSINLNNPHSVALDDRGGLYIADIGNHRIRRVDLERGTIETTAGTGEKRLPRDGQVARGNPILGPRALFVDGRTLWIALREGHSLWKMDLDRGLLCHVAGTGEKGYSGDGGPALEAQFNGPKGVALGPDGNVDVVDTENQVIRRIDVRSGLVTTIAGAGPDARGYGGDGGPATSAKLDRPHGICVSAGGVVYIGDTNSHRVRRVRFER